MDNIQLLVFDIDGTLVDVSKQTVEDSAVSAINMARDKGYHILIATGRSFFFIHEDVRKRINTEFYVTVNGACLTDQDGKIIQTHQFSQKTLEDLIAYCKEHKYPLGIKYNDHIGVYGDYEYFLKTYIGKTHPAAEFLIDDNKNKSHLTSIPLGVYAYAPVSELDNIKSEFLELHFTPTEFEAVEATLKGVNKTKTIDEVVNDLGITWDNVAAFGDGHNDIEMLEKAKIGVAMGNSSDTVKNIADYVTDTVLNDGIEKALKHLKFI